MQELSSINSGSFVSEKILRKAENQERKGILNAKQVYYVRAAVQNKEFQKDYKAYMKQWDEKSGIDSNEELAQIFVQKIVSKSVELVENVRSKRDNLRLAIRQMIPLNLNEDENCSNTVEIGIMNEINKIVDENDFLDNPKRYMRALERLKKPSDPVMKTFVHSIHPDDRAYFYRYIAHRIVNFILENKALRS